MSDAPVVSPTWISPQAALGLLRPLYAEEASAEVVLAHYAGAGLVRTWCRRLTTKKAAPHEPSGPQYDSHFINPAFWEAHSDSKRRTFTDWATGSFAAQLWLKPDWWVHRAFAVVFCQDDILALRGPWAQGSIAENWASERLQAIAAVAQLQARIAELENAQVISTAPQKLLPAPVAATSPQKAVSEAALAAWWSFYQAVRSPHERNDDDMDSHFARCFPDNSVTRARMRGLRGAQKRGPKGRSA